ncbi:MAG: hypothetical protein ACJ8BW_38065 [Ktedonobacteraceae bacterium]|jgi:CheY-like chemotaxis protein
MQDEHVNASDWLYAWNNEALPAIRQTISTSIQLTCGYAFLETLQHQELSTSIPVLVLTADVQAETKLAQQQVSVIIKLFKCA